MSQQKRWTSWGIFHGIKLLYLEDDLILVSTFYDLSHSVHCLIGPKTLSEEGGVGGLMKDEVSPLSASISF